MMTRTVLSITLLLLTLTASADDPSLGPAIEGFGPTYAIAYRDVPLREGFMHKVVFDAGSGPDDTAALNQELVSVARFMNMHARNGVPVENMDLAVVLHGAALKSALNDVAYKSRYDIANPNRELLMKLKEAGVAFYSCGQSMEFNGITKKELLSPVKVGLSAMTMLTYLQSDGYALLP